MSEGRPDGSVTQPVVGELTRVIGSGEHAQHAIVYTTIRWSFITGGILSLAAIGWTTVKGERAPLEIKDIWSIFAPIITGAMGYSFGKGR